jgi:hypothetical protein
MNAKDIMMASFLSKIAEDTSLKERFKDLLVGGFVMPRSVRMLAGAAGQPLAEYGLSESSEMIDLANKVKNKDFISGIRSAIGVNKVQVGDTLNVGKSLMLNTSMLDRITSFASKITGTGKEKIIENIAGAFDADTEKLKEAIKSKIPYVQTRLRPGYAHLLAHELGHAKNVKGLLQKLMITRGIGSTAALGMATLGGESAQEYAPYVAGAGWVPTLAEEARASYLAHKGIKSWGAKVKPEVLTKALSAVKKKFGAAWGTYLLAAAASTITPWLISKYRQQKDT